MLRAAASLARNLPPSYQQADFVAVHDAARPLLVQEWIDRGGLKGRAVTSDGIRETHRRFCELLPEDLLWVEDPEKKEHPCFVPYTELPPEQKAKDHIFVGVARAFIAAFGS